MNTAVDVRLGKVTDVNKEKRLVRCKFEDTGITSGWLPVMQHYKAIVYTESAGEHNHQYIHPTLKSKRPWMAPARFGMKRKRLSERTTPPTISTSLMWCGGCRPLMIRWSACTSRASMLMVLFWEGFIRDRWLPRRHQLFRV